MLPLVSPESSAVHIVEAIPEITANVGQLASIPPMPLRDAEGILYSANNYFKPGSTPQYVNRLGELVNPPREAQTVGNELRMIGWILEHQGIIPPQKAA